MPSVLANATDVSITWSVRLSHSCTLLKPLDRITCHLARTLTQTQVYMLGDPLLLEFFFWIDNFGLNKCPTVFWTKHTDHDRPRGRGNLKVWKSLNEKRHYKLRPDQHWTYGDAAQSEASLKEKVTQKKAYFLATSGYLVMSIFPNLRLSNVYLQQPAKQAQKCRADSQKFSNNMKVLVGSIAKDWYFW